MSGWVERLWEDEKTLVVILNFAPFPIMFSQPSLSWSLKLRNEWYNVINQKVKPEDCKAYSSL